MTTAPPSSQAPVSTEAKPAEPLRPVDLLATQEQRDRFEQLLRAKSGPKDERDAEDLTTHAAAGGMFAPPAPVALQAASAQAAGAAAAAIETKTGARAAIEAALNANSSHVAPLGGTDPAAVWEASVREPNSVAVDVRLTRAEKAANETQPSWNLTIASSTVDAETLARHAPRLNERLRKRGLGLDHVRIQRDEGDA